MDNLFNKNQFKEIFKKPKAVIDLNKERVDVLIKNVDLEEGKKETLGRLIIKAEKSPLDIDSLDEIGVVDFSEENKETQELVKKAEKLSEISDERKRIDSLLKLVKSKITYGYEHVLESIAKEKEIEKEELDEFGTKGNKLVIPFAEILKYRVGVCGHLSGIYLYLANKAKLKGIIVHSHPSFTPINIMRTDKDEKLFKSVEVEEKTSNHTWVEIQLEDGTWIPIDPSVEITGTSPEGEKMFKDANYKGCFLPMIDINCENSLLDNRGIKKFNGVISTGEGLFTIDPEIGMRKQLYLGNIKKRSLKSSEEKIKITSNNYLGNVKFKEVIFETI